MTGWRTGCFPCSPLVLWDHHDPQLYYVDLRLRRGGVVLDEVRTYFGMRKISAELTPDGGPAALALNGRALYLRGALHQSFYPDGVYTAGDARTLRDDIAFAKKAGFDFLRIHIKIDDPLLLYYADTLGMLLMTDFPNFGEGGDTLLGRSRFETMMRAAVERDFNHPVDHRVVHVQRDVGFRRSGGTDEMDGGAPSDHASRHGSGQGAAARPRRQRPGRRTSAKPSRTSLPRRSRFTTRMPING